MEELQFMSLLMLILSHLWNDFHQVHSSSHAMKREASGGGEVKEVPNLRVRDRSSRLDVLVELEPL